MFIYDSILYRLEYYQHLFRRRASEAVTHYSCAFIYPRVDSWMLLAENAALSARGFICEDGSELPKEEGQEARIPASSGMPGRGVRTEPVGECTGGWGEGIGIQSAQERIPTPVPSDDDEEG
jgi:hypothetical protein